MVTLIPQVYTEIKVSFFPWEKQCNDNFFVSFLRVPMGQFQRVSYKKFVVYVECARGEQKVVATKSHSS